MRTKTPLKFLAALFFRRNAQLERLREEREDYIKWAQYDVPTFIRRGIAMPELGRGK